MAIPKRRPATPAALRASLKAKLNAEARKRGVAPDPIRKQFVFALLYRRMFTGGGDGWMVLGGNALLLRTGGGRFTKDVDLSRPEDWANDEELLRDLRTRVARDVGDPFTIVVDRIDHHDHRDQYGYGGKSAKAYLTVTLGGIEFEKFTADLSVRRHIDGPVDHISPTPVIDHESLQDLPAVPVVPIENHLADKVCAMYETHWEDGPSTRYRDLADLVRMVRDLSIDAARARELLSHERDRRSLKTLPDALESPHESWRTEYPKAARDFAEFPSELHELDASLRAAGACLDEVLAARQTTGTWDPSTQTWVES